LRALIRLNFKRNYIELLSVNRFKNNQLTSAALFSLFAYTMTQVKNVLPSY